MLVRFLRRLVSFDCFPLLQLTITLQATLRLEAMFLRLEAITLTVGWRPCFFGWKPSLLGWRPSLLGWRPSLKCSKVLQKPTNPSKPQQKAELLRKSPKANCHAASWQERTASLPWSPGRQLAISCKYGVQTCTYVQTPSPV